MNIAGINTVHYGSTGKIMLQIASKARESGHFVKTFSKTWKNNEKVNTDHTYIGTYLNNICHRILSPITAKDELFSYNSTKTLIRQLKLFSPDIIHLHNLHGWYLNLPLLFNYIKEYNIHVVWTLHDCWSFTGQCPHFVIADCNRWKTGCHHCPIYREYPATLYDRTKTMYKLKKEWFTGVKNLTIVTPSQWLASLVKQSYLNDYPVKVIHNGIDLTVFTPSPSDFRAKHKLENKFIVLGVAFGWGRRKGLDVFIELSKRLDKEKYQIVLVGTDSNVDKQLPKNIISIHRTQNQTELAELYTAADVFANPTREEVLGVVNIETLACGTPVITFNTGGSPEIIDENTGAVVDCDDIDAMEKEIIRICETRPYTKAACLEKAREFDMHKRFDEYIDLYKELGGLNE